MSLQRPEVHLSRGHVLDERWAQQSDRGLAGPPGPGAGVGTAVGAAAAAVARSWGLTGPGSRWLTLPSGHAPVNSRLAGATRKYSAFSAAGPLNVPFDVASLGRKSCW